MGEDEQQRHVPIVTGGIQDVGNGDGGEEATLDARFSGAYTAYKEGRAEPVSRRFSWARVMANREYRAMTGLLIAFAYLYWRI